MPMDYDITPDDLDPTMDEIISLESLTGKKLDTMSNIEATKGMVYLAIRRNNPDFTWEDAGKIKLSVLTGLASANPPQGSDGE